VRSIFRNEIDKIMTPYKKSNPDFYSGYFAARAIVNRAASARRAEAGDASAAKTVRIVRIFALREYFRSDTSGLAHSCDMYPNRLSL